MSQRFSIQNTEHFNPHYKSYVTLTTTVIYNFNGNPELSTVVMISQVISAFYKAFGQTFIKAGGRFNGKVLYSIAGFSNLISLSRDFLIPVFS